MLKKIIKIIKKRGVVIIFSLVFFFVLLSPYFLFAQERKLEIEYPEIFGLKPETLEIGLAEYIRYIFSFSVAIIGLILFGSLIRGGILYLISTGNVAKLKEARDQISSAFLGAILLLSGYLILTTINPELVKFEFPPLKKPKFCEENKDCPRGFECEKKEGKCVIKTSCKINEDCPYTYECREGKCVKMKEEITQIYWEIPIGPMLEKGLWEEKRTDELEALVRNFEEFLKEKIETESASVERISDLNHYLKQLTQDCHCEELEGLCQKPKNFALPVGCQGNPCKKVEKKINKVLKINKEKSEELLAYKEKLIEIKNIFEEEGRKFRRLTDEVLEGCKERGLLTRAEYYESVASIEEQGGTTKLERLYLPAKDDPLVFYCPVGGTIFDYPYTPEKIYPEELELAEEFTLEPVEGEPLSCPIAIPLGEKIMDQLSGISYETNTSLEELIYYIDKILVELSKMNILVQQCYSESRCKIDCACDPPNPCYEKACGDPPNRINKCGIGKCTPPTPADPNLCYFLCDSPCLQTLGGCHGDSCPRQEIKETVERIKIYEDEIFKLLKWIKGDIKNAEFFLKSQEEEEDEIDKVDLNKIRAYIQTCLSMGPGTTEKPEEEPFWTLLSCEMALGNKGPDDEIITDCHPLSFFCCTSKPDEAPRFPLKPLKERPSVYIPPPEGVYSPLASGHNQVPYFSQRDPRWAEHKFGCGGTKLNTSGCGPTSLAMALNFFGAKVDPPTVADWVLKNGYRVCGVGTGWGFCCAGVKAFINDKDIKCNTCNLNGLLKEFRTNGKNKVAIVSSKGKPPYTEKGHFIVLTGMEQESGIEFVYYNDPYFNPLKPSVERPAQGKKPADWFERRGVGACCVIYK
ncbi:MAG: C39 family peptidase [Patescibacteria group bacterium]|nr:C39 family peptidase [Patescibacteria group bacterium]